MSLCLASGLFAAAPPMPQSAATTHIMQALKPEQLAYSPVDSSWSDAICYGDSVSQSGHRQHHAAVYGHADAHTSPAQPLHDPCMRVTSCR